MIESNTLPTITASRVSLRWLTDEDVPALFEIFSDPEVMRYWSSPPMQDISEALQLLHEIHENHRRRALFQWGITRHTDDRIIGTCTLFNVDSRNRRAEVGYALGQDHWGRGYMREALTALLEYAFGALDLHRLEADVDPSNAASIRSLERLGFQREGHLRERWLVGGKIFDSYFYGLLRREWKGERTRSL